MPIRIKICGLTNRDDAVAAVEAGADAVGVVFYKKSPRCAEIAAGEKNVTPIPPVLFPVGGVLD